MSQIDRARPADQQDAGRAEKGGGGWPSEPPTLLGSEVLARQPSSPSDDIDRPTLSVAAAEPKPLPHRWPAKLAEPVWRWLAGHRPPMAVLVGGAEGGVGTSLVAALLAETIAAASPGPTLVVDQCGTAWGSLTRRLLGQREGLLRPAQVGELLQHGARAQDVLRGAPTTPAGATVVTDGPAYTPLRDLFRLVQTVAGGMVVDGGRADLLFVARREPAPVLVLVGRADVIGAEAVCAALGFLRHRVSMPPVVVLSSSAPADPGRVEAARKLVATTGVPHLVHLPFDRGLSASLLVQLDRVGKTTAQACLELVTRVTKTQEVLGYVR